jgi:hypothetical protein
MRPCILAMAAIAFTSISASAQVLSWQGVGPVELGMTAQEAERALNVKLGPVALPFSKDCYITGRADGKEEALSYVVVDGRIAVMFVFLRNEKQPNPNITDRNGMGVGSTEADIRRVYGKVRKQLAPDFRKSKDALEEAAGARTKHGITEPEPPPHYWVVVDSSDHKRAIIFETKNQRVLHFEIGLKPEIMSSEHRT